MNTHSVISINPIGTPSGFYISKDLLNTSSLSKKPISALRRTARLVLGISSNVRDSRRRWTFRLVIGTILMCFGLLFLDTTAISGPEYVMPGISVAMIAGGAFIASGFLTRLISLGLGIILLVFACSISMASMTEYAMVVCLAACVSALVTGSGRYSLDTLIYNRIFR